VRQGWMSHSEPIDTTGKLRRGNWHLRKTIWLWNHRLGRAFVCFEFLAELGQLCGTTWRLVIVALGVLQACSSVTRNHSSARLHALETSKIEWLRQSMGRLRYVWTDLYCRTVVEELKESYGTAEGAVQILLDTVSGRLRRADT
jgi:hypothetical protein